MDRYELPIKVSRISGGYSIALALNDQTVISRQMSRADLMQLRAERDVGNAQNKQDANDGKGKERTPPRRPSRPFWLRARHSESI